MNTEEKSTAEESQTQPTEAEASWPWLKYAWGILGALLVVFVLWGGVTMAAEMIERQVQKEYLELTDDASRISFAKRRANHPLGGLVLLGQAHEYYTSGNYSAAQEAYQKASQSGLKHEPVLLEESLLGVAFATYQLNADKGLAALKELAKNQERMDSTRAHAAGELLGHWIEKKEWAQARDYWQLLQTLNKAGPWQQHYMGLAQLYPQLEAK